jgi:hypothetical protein
VHVSVPFATLVQPCAVADVRSAGEREGHVGEQSGFHVEPGRFWGTC